MKKPSLSLRTVPGTGTYYFYTVISNSVAEMEYIKPYLQELASTKVTNKEWKIDINNDIDWSDAMEYHAQSPIVLDPQWKKLVQTAHAVFSNLNDYLEHTGIAVPSSLKEKDDLVPNDIVRGDDDID